MTKKEEAIRAIHDYAERRAGDLYFDWYDVFRGKGVAWRDYLSEAQSVIYDYFVYAVMNDGIEDNVK